ncbi:MAG: hypothetical protein ACREND_12255 [Gemmatimonadaceae bacterium]
MRSKSVQHHHVRAGTTLLIVIVALAILGALVAGGFFASWREARVGADSIQRTRALAAAEYGAYSALSPARWTYAWNTMPPVRHARIAREALDRDVFVDVNVWKLSSATALITSLGSAGQPDRRAQRRVGIVVAFRLPLVPRLAAATAIHGVAIADSSVVSGRDSAGLDCPPAESAIAALAIPDGGGVDTAACTTSPCAIGNPSVRRSPEAGSVETYERFGQVDRSFLSTIATPIPSGSVLSPAPRIDDTGSCDPHAPGNFGDPLRALGADSPCKSYFALVHANGDIRLVGGAGQGMLLVDGDFTLKTGARFDGVVIARGAVHVESGAQVFGLVMADHIALEGGSIVHYSSCAVDRALVAGARPVPQPGQSWTEMF